MGEIVLKEVGICEWVCSIIAEGGVDKTKNKMLLKEIQL